MQTSATLSFSQQPIYNIKDSPEESHFPGINAESKKNSSKLNLDEFKAIELILLIRKEAESRNEPSAALEKRLVVCNANPSG